MLGPYLHRHSAPQAQQGLPLSNLQYGELAAPSSTQAALRHPLLDGPQVQYNSSETSLSPGCDLRMPVSMNRHDIWDNQLEINSLEDPIGNSYYHYSSFAANENEDTLINNIHSIGFNNMLDAHEHNNNMCGDPLYFERAPASRPISCGTLEYGGYSRKMTAIDDEQTTEEPYQHFISSHELYLPESNI